MNIPEILQRRYPGREWTYNGKDLKFTDGGPLPSAEDIQWHWQSVEQDMAKDRDEQLKLDKVEAAHPVMGILKAILTDDTEALEEIKATIREVYGL